MTAIRKPRIPSAVATPKRYRDTKSQGILKDQRGQEQPADKKRAQKNR
jgi:hypothetical protein